jgi:predicted nucleic acid-binding protein
MREELPVMVDSNVFINCLKQGLDPVAQLSERYAVSELVTCGMIKLEVLRGIKNLKIRERLAEFMSIMQYVVADNKIWEEATEIAWRLSRTGSSLAGADAVIAASAVRADAVLLTADRDFEPIESLGLDFRLERPFWL